MTRPGPSSNFYSAIYQLTAQIPPGAVATYGQLAFLAGHPRASRIAGGAMAQAPGGKEVSWEGEPFRLREDRESRGP